MLAELVTGDSFIHRLDPRVKIVLVALFSGLVALLNRFGALGAALALGLFIVLLAGIPKEMLLRRLIPVNAFILFLWFFLPFTLAGEPLFSLGPLVGTHEGVLYAARISIKSNAIMVVLIALVASTSVFTLGHALGALRVPAKLVHLLFFTLRYAHVIHQECLRLLNAMKMRGFRPGTNLHTYKTFAYLVGMLLVRSLDRAERIRRAMLCRGFTGNLKSLGTFSIKGADVVSLILMLTLLGTLGVLEWTTMI
ncbi:MAG: cobalt ECF transporter T component CbiQ [Thermodesulfobacteriota bacterium]|nr:cobalt ECF transporter T component CbiQ [Thermodesulfobacteriota bacterium]